MTGSTRCDGYSRLWWTAWRATRVSASLPYSLPVFGLRSNLGKFDDDTSRRSE